MADVDNSDQVLIRRKVFPGIDKVLYADPHQELDDNGKGKLPNKKKESPYSFGNFMWIVAAIAVLYCTDIGAQAFVNVKVARWWFNLGSVLIGLNVGICSFLIFYVSFYQKIDSDHWEELYPFAIPVATAAFGLGSFCLNVALWPVYSFLTPVFLFVLFMGVVVIIAMLPAF